MGRSLRIGLQFVLALIFGVASSICRGEDAAPNNAVYEIFVRSFAASKAGHPGDLAGIQQKFDYLNDGKADSLEVGILWLMPIFPATSYHGYDVTDYRNVNPDYGTLNDLQALLTEAHKRHVRIILDIPFNHTSNQHPWFKAAIESAQDPHRAWYFIFPEDGHLDDGWHTVTNSHGERLKYFGLFGDSMPDLNYDTPAVRSEIKDVAKFWLGQGVDGFRLDAAKHIYGWTVNPTESDILNNNAWWHEFSASVHAINKDAILVGEVLGDRGILIRHAWGLDALLDEPFMNATRAEIEKPFAGFVAGWKQFITSARAENPNKPFDSFVFLSSHDQNPRLESQLEKDLGASAIPAARLGMSIMMALGKYPILYEGDELGQRGWKWNGNQAGGNAGGDSSGVFDETLREPLPWHKSKRGSPEAVWDPPGHGGFLPKFERADDGISVDDENPDPTSLLNLVRAFNGFRAHNPTFANGEIGDVITDGTDWLVFERVLKNDSYVVLINPTSQGNSYRFYDKWYPKYAHANMEFWSDGRLKQWRDESGQNDKINESVFVPPFGIVILHP